MAMSRCKRAAWPRLRGRASQIHSLGSAAWIFHSPRNRTCFTALSTPILLPCRIGRRSPTCLERATRRPFSIPTLPPPHGAFIACRSNRQPGPLTHPFVRLQEPRLRHGLKPNMGVIAFRRRSRQQQDASFWSALDLSPPDEFLADSSFLMRKAHRQIGQIRDVMEIGEGPRNSHQQFTVPGGDDQVRVAQHGGETFAIINRPPLAESRGFV